MVSLYRPRQVKSALSAWGWWRATLSQFAVAHAISSIGELTFQMEMCRSKDTSESNAGPVPSACAKHSVFEWVEGRACTICTCKTECVLLAPKITSKGKKKVWVTLWHSVDWPSFYALHDNIKLASDWADCYPLVSHEHVSFLDHHGSFSHSMQFACSDTVM